MVNKVNRLQGAAAPVRQTRAAESGGQAEFGAMLSRQIETRETGQNGPVAGPQTVNFSKHALARAEERGIELTQGLMDKLADSVEKAREKGARNILAFDSTQAFILNIPYGRVITTMSQEEMKENIFTNIDGAVLL